MHMHKGHLLITLCVLGQLVSSSPASAATFVQTTSPTDTTFEELQRDEALRVKTVQQMLPAVAGIFSSSSRQTSDALQNDLNQVPSAQTTVSGGTAFFISPDGLMFTNNHVIDQPNQQMNIMMNDGRRATAKVVYSDPKNDIAILKASVKSPVYLRLTGRNSVYIAQNVIAIGNALGELNNTVSLGIVSGIQRTIVASTKAGNFSEKLTNMIQIDAALNEGSSGGPLLNSRGEVIGMNTAFVDGGQTIGFALPVTALRTALQAYQAKR